MGGSSSFICTTDSKSDQKITKLVQGNQRSIELENQKKVLSTSTTPSQCIFRQKTSVSLMTFLWL